MASVSSLRPDANGVVRPFVAGLLQELAIEKQDIVPLKPLALAALAEPRAVRHFRVQLAGQQRQVAERVDAAIPLRLVVAVAAASGRAISAASHARWQDFPRATRSSPRPGFAVFPAAPVILDRLEHHAQPSAAETPIGEQARKLLPELRIVRPVPAAAGLAGQITSRSHRPLSRGPTFAAARRARRRPGCSSSWSRARACGAPSSSRRRPAP